MRYKTAIVKNIEALASAYDALETADKGIPRMGLVYGVPGVGKTMAVAWLQQQTNAILLRASPTWTVTTMLNKIVFECGMEEQKSAYANLEAIVRHMKDAGRPLFIDEVDMFTSANVKPSRAGAIVETLRNIHDIAQMPVVLIGMSGVERYLSAYKQVTSRFSQTVRFDPARIEDARILADTICEVPVHDDLLELLHSKSKGNMRLISIGLSKIERAAKTAGMKEIGLAQWGGKSFGLSGETTGGSHAGD